MANSHQFDHMMSDSDDESFVVLGSSIPPESLLEIRKEDCQEEEIDRSIIQQSIDSAKEALSEISAQSVSDKLPSLPKVEPLSSIPSNDPNMPDTTSSLKSNMSDMSQSEIQQRVENLIEENTKLKDALVQNHLTLKKQYDTIAMWNEDVQKVHEIHKQKFAETKAYVEKLKIENGKLKEALQVAENNVSCLREEIGALKGGDANIQKLNEELYKTTFDNLHKFEQENAQSKIADLNEQLQARENVIVDLKGEIARLKSEIERTNIEKQMAETESQFSRQLSLKEESLQDEIEKLKVGKEQLNRQINEDHKASIMKQSKLIEEIDALRESLAQKSNSEKEAIDRVQEQLMLAQIQITELQEKAKKDKETMDRMARDNDDYKKGIQGLQARVVDPAVIIDKDKRIEHLEKVLNETKSELEVVPVLKEQLDIFKADFEAEREAKNALKSQKDTVLEDLTNLQRRNQQLLEEVEVLRAATGNNPEIGRRSSTTQNPTATTEATTPPPQRYNCPLCLRAFRTLRFLEQHVEDCLQTDGGQ